MREEEPYIRLTLDVPDAVELSDFVGSFTALASEYERFIQDFAPKGAGPVTLYVSEVRRGSIIASLVPIASTLADVMDGMGRVLIVEQFVRLYGARLNRFLQPNVAPPSELRTTELRDFAEQVAAIANNQISSLEIAAIEVKNRDHEVKAAFRFTTPQAREIRDRVGERDSRWGGGRAISPNAC